MAFVSEAVFVSRQRKTWTCEYPIHTTQNFTKNNVVIVVDVDFDVNVDVKVVDDDDVVAAVFVSALIKKKKRTDLRISKFSKF